MSPLEAALRDPDPIAASAARADALGRLDDIHRRLQSALAEGLPPGDYAVAAAAADACIAARETVERFTAQSAGTASPAAPNTGAGPAGTAAGATMR